MRNSATRGSILIIGYGNPLREDDAVGWRAAERIEQTLHREDVKVMTVHQLTPELADPIAHSQLTIFIDAAATTPPGQVDCIPACVNDQPSHSLNHSASPAALLRSAATIFGKCPNAYVVSVGVERFGYSEKLSPTVANAVPEVIQQVKELIAEHAIEHQAHA